MPIYGRTKISELDDALVDIVKISNTDEKKNAEAVGLLFKKEYTSSVTNFSSPLQSFFQKVYSDKQLVDFVGKRLALAEFAETGTCFLVNKNLIFSAKHVIENNNPTDFRVVFKAWDKTTGGLEKTKIYSVQSIVEKGSTHEEDWVTLRLTEQVNDIKPLSVIRDSPIKKDSRLYILGFPLSWPQKRGEGKVMENISASISMKTRVDAFIGNSGSPVFDESNNTVVGMYISSGADFDMQDPKAVTLVMDGENGQETTKDTVLKIPSRADFS